MEGLKWKKIPYAAEVKVDRFYDESTSEAVSQAVMCDGTSWRETAWLGWEP